jgi:hypothetical protein
MTTTNASCFGLALYGVGLVLVANVAGHVTLDRAFLWMGVAGVVAIVVGLGDGLGSTSAVILSYTH